MNAPPPSARTTSRTAWYLAAFLAVVGGAVFWLGLEFRALRADLEHVRTTDDRLLVLAGKIVHLDEVLTMSARLAAATGDPAWEERYRRFEPQLDAAIQESLRIDPEIVGQFIARTDAANRKLVEMENTAFKRVRSQDLHGAAAILSSSEYENQKRLYSEGIQGLSAALDVHVAAAQGELQRRMRFVVSALLVVLVVPFCFWVLLLRAGKRQAESEHQARWAVEQAQEQTARRIAEERFRVLFESSRDAIMTLEPPTWRFTSGNRACIAVFGARDEAHFTSLSPGDVSPEFQPDGRASADKAREAIGKALAEGSHLFEWQHQRVDGKEFPATVLLTRMEVGGKAFLQATVRDITAQKQEQTARRIAEERFRAMSTSAHDAIIMVGPDARISFWNRAAATMFGWTEAEAVGRDLHEMLAPARFHPAACAGFDLFRKTGTGGAIGKTLELAAKRRDGTEFPMEISLAVLQIGSEWHAVGIIRDITERKQAETALIEASARAEEANRAKSEFLANMSHEIRTPMNGIIGMTELALETTLTPEQRHFLETVQSSAVTLLTLLNDILDFSKIEAGKLELEEVGFQVREVLADALRSESLRADRKGLELALAVDSTVPEQLVGDPLRLRQVVVNLVGNAVKFTDKGEIVVRVTAHDSAADAVELAVSVSDTGIGIPKDKQGSVFQAFTQADGSTTRRFGGTGLGLTISRQLVKLMGGTLSVESPNPSARTGGPGSVFSFRARLRRQAEGESVACRLLPEQLTGLKILVVDDNETNREILTQMLCNWKTVPVAVDSALSAVVALERATQLGEPFRLVLLDCNMPGGDGFSLMEHLRADPSYSDLPAIMLSSGPRPGDNERRKRLGVKGFLLKPLKQSELLDAVLLCLGTLVMEQARRHRDTPSAKDSAGAATGPGAARSLRVLVAEDNAVNQELAVHALTKQGHQATVVGTGKAAVERLQREAFDVVLMDIQMPEMDGLTATRVIRDPTSGVLNHDILIIAMTAHAMKGDRERCLEAGMSGYIAKPVTQQQLAGVIRDVVGSSEPAREPTDEATGGTSDQDLLGRFDGDASFLAHVARLFLGDCEPLLTAVRNAAAASDREALRIAAHTLKGMVAVFGYEPAQETALRLEVMGREGNLAGVDAAVTQLETAVGTLRDSLHRFAAEHPAGGSGSAT